MPYPAKRGSVEAIWCTIIRKGNCSRKKASGQILTLKWYFHTSWQGMVQLMLLTQIVNYSIADRKRSDKGKVLTK